MWEILRLPSWGRFSLRKMGSFFVAVLLSAIFIAIGNSHDTFAAPATWSGDSLSYNGATYNPIDATLPGTAPGSTAYSNGVQPVASVIILPSGADKAREITNATVRDYNFDGTTYSNHDPPNDQTVTISAQSGIDSNGSTEGEGKTSCDIDGVGWIVCSTSRFIAGAMDRVYGWINGFLTVKPLSTDTSSGLYQAWNITRGLANAAFIVAFLLIIYAQITSYGISNYEIKKMIPKLIIAAILVNVSYFVCAAAVDASNILGDSIQAALMQIRDSLPAPIPEGDWWSSWEGTTTAILSGGTIAGAGFLAMTGGATGGAISAMAALLVPVLIAGMLSILVALIVLAARQAVITVLIVLSPLAFVAYLLPNTEKYFEKWRGIFTTMLLVFPMFSLLFGGSQLASHIIIQNTNQVSVVILALFVQVAPLALTPFLIKFSGSLLGRFAGMVNNPQKGLVDRSRNWAKDRASTLAQRRMEAGENSRFGLGRVAYKREMRRRDWAGRRKGHEAMLGASWDNSKTGQYINKRHHDAELYGQVGKTAAEVLHEEAREHNPVLLQRSGQVRENQAAIQMMKKHEDANWEEMKSRNMGANNPYAHRAPAVRALAEEQRVVDSRVAAAQMMQNSEHAVDLIKSPGLQQRMGGIADHGDQRALAIGVSQYRKDYNDRINEANAIIKHYNLSGQQRQDHAMGKEVWAADSQGNMKAFRKDSVFTREAAIDYQVKIGTYDQVEQIVEASGSDLQGFRTTISSAMAEAKVGQKAVFMGGRTIDRVAQGQIPDRQALMQVVLESVAKGKISVQDLATNEDKGLQRIFEAVRDRSRYENALSQEDRQNLDVNIQKLLKRVDTVLTDEQIGATLKENSRDVLDKFRGLNPPQAGGTTPGGSNP